MHRGTLWALLRERQLGPGQRLQFLLSKGQAGPAKVYLKPRKDVSCKGPSIKYVRKMLALTADVPHG